MNPLRLTTHEILHRWKSSLLTILIVSAITGALTYFTVNNVGFQKEISRNARDIGSNVVILPAAVDQFQYHAEGGYSEVTMSNQLLKQLIEYHASLNHLIPMLERKTELTHGETSATARVIGITASVPMPGRPKSPMQKSVPENKLQLGSELANQLGIGRDDESTIMIKGRSFRVDRVNRSNGTWQDSAAFMDLETAQVLFELTGQISRIEAIECTSEQCELTGLKSDVVLANELARITDQARILRREKMADARSSIRVVSRDNLRLIQNAFWILLVTLMIALSFLNASQRRSEVGVLQALGYGRARVALTFILRAILLASAGALIGILAGALSANAQSGIFSATSNKFAIDWTAAATIGIAAVVLAALASSFPALVAASRPPAEIMGRDV